MYARGILFGKMKYELGDHSFVRCPENNLVADIDFKTKGYFSGTYNAIGGVIRNEKTQEILYELSGMWNGEMYLKDILTGHKELLFDASHSKPSPPAVRPLEEQAPRESQKLWHRVTSALKERDHEVATEEKGRIEEMQREEAAKRAEDGVDWRPRFFRPVNGGPGGSEEGDEDLDWILNANIDGSTIESQIEQIRSVAPILIGDKASQEFAVPPKHSKSSSSAQPPQPPAQQRVCPDPIPETQQRAPSVPMPETSNGDNLIDFGDDVPAASTNGNAPMNVEQPQYQQFYSQMDSQPTQYNPPMPPGLQQPLQPGLQPANPPQSASTARSSSIEHVEARANLENGMVDEFVDAEEGPAGTSRRFF
ncbi:MAG: hypothetical protein M1837_002012 [Sclerophora amabilis]|nr:MAG: hypothetical protein M1837_002012 [Sclerophora amabilis]